MANITLGKMIDNLDGTYSLESTITVDSLLKDSVVMLKATIDGEDSNLFSESFTIPTLEEGKTGKLNIVSINFVQV